MYFFVNFYGRRKLYIVAYGKILKMESSKFEADRDTKIKKRPSCICIIQRNTNIGCCSIILQRVEQETLAFDIIF